MSAKPQSELPLFIRIPSYSLGNTGDAALISVLKQHLADIPSLKYSCPLKKYKHNIPLFLSKYRGMIYFGNDCLAYYNVDAKICQAFLKAGRPVLFINCSYGPIGTTKNDKVLKPLLAHPLCHLIARDQLSYNEITARLDPKNTVLLAADLAFSSSIKSIPEICASHNDCSVINMLDDTPLCNWWQSRINNSQNNGNNNNNNNKRLKTLIINLHEDYGSPKNNAHVINSIQNAATNPNGWIGCQLLAGKLAIIFLSHDSRKPETVVSARVASNIRANLPEKIRTNIIVSPCIDPELELAILNSGYIDAILTGRMHLSILGMTAGVPSVAIAYNGIKAAGTFGHFKGIVADTGVLTVDSISSEVVDNLVKNIIVDKRSEYLECIQNAMPFVKELAIGQIEKIQNIFS